jgi:XTP/dITP diphosphohydrolase
MDLLIASTNFHKIRELREMLKLFNTLDILSLHQFPHYLPTDENGANFQENAIAKAIHAATNLNKWVLADDSGLVVPSLNGEPGIFSRRYAGPNATDQENRDKLLQSMQHLNEMSRSAYYECCLALAAPDGSIKKYVTGTCEGSILLKARGRNGFGYDPIFVKQEYEKSFAELDDSVKNRISHRRKAMERLSPCMEGIFA